MGVQKISPGVLTPPVLNLVFLSAFPLIERSASDEIGSEKENLVLGLDIPED